VAADNDSLAGGAHEITFAQISARYALPIELRHNLQQIKYVLHVLLLLNKMRFCRVNILWRAKEIMDNSPKDPPPVYVMTDARVVDQLNESYCLGFWLGAAITTTIQNILCFIV
jgi:hypothetical protein